MPYHQWCQPHFLRIFHSPPPPAFLAQRVVVRALGPVTVFDPAPEVQRPPERPSVRGRLEGRVVPDVGVVIQRVVWRPKEMGHALECPRPADNEIAAALAPQAESEDSAVDMVTGHWAIAT